MVREREAVRVGGDVDAYCTKCRMDLTHTIHAVVNGAPARVECNTCHGVHQYRAPKSQKGSPKPTREATASPSAPKAHKTESSAPRARANSPAAIAETWQTSLQGKEEAARPYRFGESYAIGDVVRHTQFGLGLVEERLSPQKICVLFRAGRKILIDNRETAAG